MRSAQPACLCADVFASWEGGGAHPSKVEGGMLAGTSGFNARSCVLWRSISGLWAVPTARPSSRFFADRIRAHIGACDCFFLMGGVKVFTSELCRILCLGFAFVLDMRSTFAESAACLVSGCRICIGLVAFATNLLVCQEEAFGEGLCTVDLVVVFGGVLPVQATGRNPVEHGRHWGTCTVNVGSKGHVPLVGKHARTLFLIVIEAIPVVHEHHRWALGGWCTAGRVVCYVTTGVHAISHIVEISPDRRATSDRDHGEQLPCEEPPRECHRKGIDAETLAREEKTGCKCGQWEGLKGLAQPSMEWMNQKGFLSKPSPHLSSTCEEQSDGSCISGLHHVHERSAANASGILEVAASACSH